MQLWYLHWVPPVHVVKIKSKNTYDMKSKLKALQLDILSTNSRKALLTIF